MSASAAIADPPLCRMFNVEFGMMNVWKSSDRVRLRLRHFNIHHSTFLMPRHEERGLPCAERIEKTLTHRKLIPLQAFHNGMSQISSGSSDAEMNPM